MYNDDNDEDDNDYDDDNDEEIASSVCGGARQLGEALRLVCVLKSGRWHGMKETWCYYQSHVCKVP